MENAIHYTDMQHDSDYLNKELTSFLVLKQAMNKLMNGKLSIIQ